MREREMMRMANMTLVNYSGGSSTINQAKAPPKAPTAFPLSFLFLLSLVLFLFFFLFFFPYFLFDGVLL